MTSKLVHCDNHVEMIHFPYERQILAKNKTKVTIESDTRYIHIKFNLQEYNVSKLNFRHDLHIINPIDVISKFNDLTDMNEANGAYHINNEKFSEADRRLKGFFEEHKDETHNIILIVLFKILGSTIGSIIKIILILRLAVKIWYHKTLLNTPV